MGKLDGKVCVLTGCASGLAKQIAIRFADEGCKKMAILDYQEEKLMVTKQICEEKGAEVLAMKVDLSRADMIEEFVKATIEKFGPHIDALVNIAHNTTPLVRFMEKPEEDLDTEWKCGPLAMWRMIKFFYPYMKGHPGAGASIINFSSKAGMEGTPLHSSYATVKEAIRGMSRVMAKEFGPDNVRVNTIMPAGTTDNMAEGLKKLSQEARDWAEKAFVARALGRKGDPYDDVAPVVVFMASDDSHWITGDNIHADGGAFIHA